MLSLIIPVYKNEENLPRLLAVLAELNQQLERQMEVVFVVDGSPDRCQLILSTELVAAPFRSRLVALSRNFGSFLAITAGLHMADGDYFAVMAADLQEPPELIVQAANALRKGEADIVFGCRNQRADPWLSELFSNSFWYLYRRLVVKDMPKGGVDVFACTRQVRERLLEFKEVNTNLIALLFWLGFRRKFITYQRLPREEGKSAWTLAKKIQYCSDSIFNFTDLPVRLLLYTGILGILFSAVCSALVLAVWVFGPIRVPGYTPIVLAIMFFGALTSFASGILGQYLWLSLQNSRNRPPFVIAGWQKFSPDAASRVAAGQHANTSVGSSVTGERG